MHPGFITSNMPEEYVAFSSVDAYELRFRDIHEQDAILVRVDLLGTPTHRVRAHLLRNWNEWNSGDFR
jgi:hypothetical protein